MAKAALKSRIKSKPRGDELSRWARDSVLQSLKAVGEALGRAAKPFRGDVEPIHDVRVSTRRAAATVHFFEDQFSKRHVTRWRKRLKRIRRAAGVARDADVRVELLTARGAESQVLDAIRAEQKSARKEIQKVRRKAKDNRWFKGRLRELLRSLERGNDVSRQAWMSHRWEGLSRDYLANAVLKPATIETLHRFRIQTKTLRYQLELLEHGLPRRAHKQTLGLLIRVQDDLGNLIDQVTLLDRLERLEPAHPHGQNRNSTSFRKLKRDIDSSRKAFVKDWVTSRERELSTRLNDLVSRMNRDPASR